MFLMACSTYLTSVATAVIEGVVDLSIRYLFAVANGTKTLVSGLMPEVTVPIDSSTPLTTKVVSSMTMLLS
jgi:hypothetical protein